MIQQKREKILSLAHTLAQSNGVIYSLCVLFQHPYYLIFYVLNKYFFLNLNATINHHPQNICGMM